MNYGYKKVPVKKARTGEDIAMDTGASALQGAQQGREIGGMFGPKGELIGAGIGAAAFGINSYIKGKDAQAKERGIQANTEALNRGFDRLESTGNGFNKNVMTTQYKHGGKTKLGNAEVEDGELLVGYDEKKPKIEKVYKGASHDNGGIAESFDKKDAGKYIVPKKDAPKVKYLIKRYRLNGDKSAKKSIDNYLESLPTQDVNEVYAEDGAQLRSDEAGNEYRYEDGKYFYKPKGGDWSEQSKESGTEAIRSMFPDIKNDIGNMPGVALHGENALNLSRAEKLKFKDYGFKPHNTGDIIPSTAEDYAKTSDGNGNSGLSYGGSFLDRNKNTSLRTGLNSYGGDLSKSGDNAKLSTGLNIADANMDLGIDSRRTGFKWNEDQDSEEGFNVNKLQGALGAAAGAANFMYNMKKGNEEIAGVNRRFCEPEEFQYKDRSERDRQANLENRNAQMGQMRGKGLSTGQLTGYGRAAGRDFLRNQSEINQNEARRADVIDQQNVQQRNRANQYNLQAADKYDTIERQQEAARDAFTGTGFSELAQMGDLARQESFMRERDKELGKRDKFAASISGTQDYGYNFDNKDKWKTKQTYKWR